MGPAQPIVSAQRQNHAGQGRIQAAHVPNVEALGIVRDVARIVIDDTGLGLDADLAFHAEADGGKPLFLFLGQAAASIVT